MPRSTVTVKTENAAKRPRPAPTPAALMAAAAGMRGPSYRSRANIKAMCEKEIKGVDYDGFTYDNGLSSTLSNNTDIYLLNSILAGSSSWNRIGRKANLLSLRLLGTIYWSFRRSGTTNFQPMNWVRMALVWDKQPTGTIPTYNSIFGTTDSAGTETADLADPLKYDNMARFKVVRNWILQPPMVKGADAAGAVYGGQQLIPIQFDEFVKLPTLETTFGASAGGIGDIATGALYLVFKSQHNIGTADTYNVMAIAENFKARLRFTD